MANSINGNLYDYNNLYGINQTNGVTTPYLSPTADPDAESLFETNLNLTGAEDIDVEAKEDEYLAALGNVEDIDEVNTENEEAKKIQEEIEELKEEKEENIKKMEELEDHIEDLVDSAKENIAKAAALQEAAVKEHQEEVDKVLEEQLNAYIEANKEGGEGMTRY